jgi:hypothetical protein
MMRTVLAGMGAFILWTSAVCAQGLPDAPASTAGPVTKFAPGVSQTTTQRTIHPDGTVTAKVEAYDRNQSFSSGAGRLSAKTVTQTSGSSAVTPPPRRAVTTTTTSSQTAETSH